MPWSSASVFIGDSSSSFPEGLCKTTYGLIHSRIFQKEPPFLPMCIITCGLFTVVFEVTWSQKSPGFPLHFEALHFWLCLEVQCFQFSSAAQSCPTSCDPMNCSTPGLPVHHQLPEFTQTHVHQFSDAIQPSHPLSSPSPPAPNPYQHPSLFQ